MRAVMVSQKPLLCENIANGKKTILITKTKPNIETPFKCYIYCTKAKTIGDIILCKSEENAKLFGHNAVIGINKGFSEKEDINLKGKVIGEFVCDKIYDIEPHYDIPTFCNQYVCGWNAGDEDDCISFSDFDAYLGGKHGYGWHISDLKIYDKPKELSEFFTADKEAIRHCENREQTYFAFTDTGYIKNGFVCKKYEDEWCFRCRTKPMSNPPSPWCYIVGVTDDE